MEHNRPYKCIRDGPDLRDFKFSFSAIQPPFQTVDLRTANVIPPVLDQGNLGSCVSNAVSNSLRYLLRKNKLPDFQPSRLFIYYFTRLIEGSVSSDSGCTIRDCMKELTSYSCCDEKLWPYTTSKFATLPSTSCVRAAHNNIKGLKYMSVTNSLVAIKACINSKNLVTIGIPVWSSFESQSTGQTGIVPMPDINTETMLGGHCMNIVGYNEIKKWFIVENSWGTGWGDKGYLYIPYDYILKYGWDFWCLQTFV